MLPVLDAEPEPLWPRLARVHLDDIVRKAAAPRSVVIGPAGAGKSVALRHLHHRLDAAGRTVVLGRRASDISSAAAEDVVLIDDAHLLDGAAIEALHDRVADPDAAIILACRPWPTPADLDAIIANLDTPGLSVILGQVSATEVTAHPGHAPLRPDCVDDLVEVCGGTTWLVSEALAIHDETECATGPNHDAIVRALEDVIAQRLQHVPAEIRMAVEIESLTPGSAFGTIDRTSDGVVAAYAFGLLLRNGHAAPVVRSAVRNLTPVDRVAALTESGLIQASSDLLDGVRGAGIAGALLQLGDAASDPARSLELYDRAVASGARAVDVAVRRSRALWAVGRLDDAASAVDSVDAAADDAAASYVANILGTAWLARGMADTAASVYRTTGAAGAAVSAGKIITALAAGDVDGLDEQPESPARAVPTTAAVAMDTLARGLRTSLTRAAQASLGELMRANDVFTMADVDEPLPEVPAVLATIVALNLGEIDVAAGILDAAARGGQGGPAAGTRLALWRGWVALQQQRPADVESAIAAGAAAPAAPRDRLLEHALRIGLARRYSDTAGITSAWRRAREATLHADFDLFGNLPLAEYVMTAARIEDSGVVERHFEQALQRAERLRTPIVWSAHLHWAGIQQGILLGQPDLLRPHARVLVDAAPISPVAAAMAHAGRVWTTVLGGTVDEDAVEAAADQLASVGLAWDGSRLAGYGAGLSENRRTISRLLACARRLHTADAAPAAADQSSGAEPAAGGSASSGASILSAREREVAALVLRGMTYAEIGTTIFISPRTAEHHIARIRQRLGATSRSDLLTKLRLALEGGDVDDD